MTVLVDYISRQLVRTTQGESGRRRLRVIMALLVIIAGAGVVMMTQRYPAVRAVEYQTPQTIVPVPSALCPGEAFTYDQKIRVQRTAMITVSRDWCNRGFTCHLDLHQSWPNVIMTPLDFSGPVTRTVPISPFFIAGNLYEFRSGVRNGDLSVQIVQFSIREDCDVKP